LKKKRYIYDEVLKFKMLRIKIYVLDNCLISYFKQFDQFFLAKVYEWIGMENPSGW
jgi:hypothetical protein